MFPWSFMRKTSSIDWFSPKKQPTSGQTELQSLLELLPYPALAVDLSHDQIHLANQKVIELTGLTHQELQANPLSHLLPMNEARLLVAAPATRQISRLTRHRGTVIEVYLELYPLGQSPTWQILKIEYAEEVERQEQAQRLRQRLSDRINGYLAALQETELGKAQNYLLSTTLEILAADGIGLYQASGNHPGAVLQAVIGQHTDRLPKEISPVELASLKGSASWSARRATHPVFLNTLRAAGYRGILGTPLGTPQAISGALIAFGALEFPPESAGLLLESAVLLNIITEQFAQRSNLLPHLQRLTVDLNMHLSLLDQVSDSIVLLNDQLFVTNLNRAALDSLGYARSEASGLRAEDILISDTLLESTFSAIRQGTPSSSSVSLRLFRRGGGSFQTTLHILPIFAPGMPGTVVVLFQDLTEHEQVRLRNEQLEQRALLGEVTASFAHEVRNPINNISTGLQVLEISLPAKDPNQAIINRLQQDCNRLTELIKSGLSFIKPMEYNLERIELNDQLKSLLDRWQHRLMRDKIQLIYQPDPTPPLIEGDPRAVEQIFNNLFTNALQAMQAQPVGSNELILGVKIRRVGQVGANDQIEISVSDTGVGIPEQIREHIFEPFYTTKPTGTGLGLAIVKRIITAHKGSIQVTSFPGATVFTIRFPAI